jgi:hypothetical protein
VGQCNVDVGEENGRDRLEDLGIDAIVILKWILKK